MATATEEKTVSQDVRDGIERFEIKGPKRAIASMHVQETPDGWSASGDAVWKAGNFHASGVWASRGGALSAVADQIIAEIERRDETPDAAGLIQAIKEFKVGLEFDAAAEANKPRGFSQNLTPETADACHIANIKEANDKVTEAEEEWDAAKEHAASAKRRYDAAVDHLRGVIDQGPERLPLFDGAAKEKAADAEAWRRAPLSELELSAFETDKFGEAGVKNIGQLEDLRAGKGFTSVDGIGPNKAGEITERLLTWLSANRDGWGQPEATEAVNGKAK